MWSFSFWIPLYISLGSIVGNRPQICQYNGNDFGNVFSVTYPGSLRYVPFNGLNSRHPSFAAGCQDVNGGCGDAPKRKGANSETGGGNCCFTFRLNFHRKSCCGYCQLTHGWSVTFFGKASLEANNPTCSTSIASWTTASRLSLCIVFAGDCSFWPQYWPLRPYTISHACAIGRCPTSERVLKP